MGSISKFCEVMRTACEDWSLGYDQSNRWDIRDGGECDCSSLVIWALKQAGFDTGTATYTGDLSRNLTQRGWKRLPFSIGAVRKGDILLNDAYHVCAVIAGAGESATIAQASIDENGNAVGGASGDQSGRETNTRTVYVYAHGGWDCILRYGGADESDTDRATLEVDGQIGPQTIAEWQRQVGTPVDGVVSGQSWECSTSYPALISVVYDGGGSSLMLEVQKRLGVPNPTGIIASGTIAMLQGWLYLHGHSCAMSRAGVLDVHTAKALQESLNAGEWCE